MITPMRQLAMAMITPMRQLIPAVLITLLAAGCGTAAGGHATGPATPPATASSRPAGSVTPVPASSASASPVPASPVPASPDPPTAAALLRIAQVFNNDYDNGNFGAVYDRWDASSQAIISRAEYIRRHTLCAPATHSLAQVEGAVHGKGGTWHVSYRIGNSSLVDTWFYIRHRWVFDISLSNPGAARDYRLPFAQYAAAVGCTTH